MKQLIIISLLLFLVNCSKTESNESKKSVPVLQTVNWQRLDPDFYLNIKKLSHGPEFTYDSANLTTNYRFVITEEDSVYTIYKELITFDSLQLARKLISRQPITHFLSQVSQKSKIKSVQVIGWTNYRTIELLINSSCYSLNLNNLDLQECEKGGT